jgi:hypothetical protein
MLVKKIGLIFKLNFNKAIPSFYQNVRSVFLWFSTLYRSYQFLLLEVCQKQGAQVVI